MRVMRKLLQMLLRADTSQKVQAGAQFASGRAKERLTKKESSMFIFPRYRRKQAEVDVVHDAYRTSLPQRTQQQINHLSAATGMSPNWAMYSMHHDAGARGVDLSTHLDNITRGQPVGVGNALGSTLAANPVPAHNPARLGGSTVVDWERELAPDGATAIRRDIANTLASPTNKLDKVHLPTAPTGSVDWGKALESTRAAAGRTSRNAMALKPVTGAVSAAAHAPTAGLAQRLRGLVSKVAADEYAWATHGKTEKERGAFSQDTLDNANQRERDMAEAFEHGASQKKQNREELSKLFARVASGNYVARQQTLRERVDTFAA